MEKSTLETAVLLQRKIDAVKKLIEISNAFQDDLEMGLLISNELRSKLAEIVERANKEAASAAGIAAKEELRLLDDQFKAL